MNIHILSLLGVATIAQVSTAMAQTAPKVNILFCVADDAGHMSAYGVPWINTPAFDTVARMGFCLIICIHVMPNLHPHVLL